MNFQIHKYGFNWTRFCGEKEFVPWDEKQHNFGFCFQKLVFKSLFFAILAIVSAYYVGKQTKCYVRTKSQNRILLIRIICCGASLLLSVIDPCLAYFYLNAPLYMVDVLSSALEISGWLIHLRYIFSLRKWLTRGTRGPRPAILAWAFTLLFYISNARTFWYTKDPIYSQLFTTTYEGIATTHIILQALYLCTLFPQGLGGTSDYPEDDEQTPLLDPSNSYYRRYQEVIDPYDLGVAEDGINKLSYLTFYWVNSMMKKGAQGRLVSVDDIFELPPHLISSTAFQKVHKEIMLNQLSELPSYPEEDIIIRTPKTKFPLLRALHKCYAIQFYSLGILKILGDTLNFAGPLLLHELVSFIDGKVTDPLRGYGAGVGLCIASLLSALCNVHYNYFLTKLNIQIRGSLVSTVFWKVQHVSAGSLSEFSSGQIVNFMSTDTDRIMQIGQSFHAFWSLPIQLILTLYLLYNQLGLASLAGVALSALMLPINKVIADKIAGLSEKMMHFKDRRVHLMNEVLSMIKAVKLNSWEGLFKGRILDERYGEVKALAGRKYLDAACVYFWATTPVLMPIITICTFAALGHELDAASIFTAVALFNMLTVPLNAYPWVINSLVESWISIKRMEKLMRVKETSLNEYFTPLSEMNHAEVEDHVLLERASFSWSNPSLPSNSVSDCQEAQQSLIHTVPVSEGDQNIFSGNSESDTSRFLLDSINIRVLKGQKIGIVGNVGSGKTAFLLSILGEMEKISGHIAISSVHQGYGYSPQEAWVQNTTIKENIIFGQSFDLSRYRSVVHSCALEEDFSNLPKKDETRCGENGASLSGGQKARVSLARAIYQNKNIYLLDDVLSSVDGPVSQHIMRHCIHTFLKDKTVFLVTHHLHLLTRMDWIINIKDGKITKQGTPKSILPSLTDEDIFLNDWFVKSPVEISASSGAVKRTVTPSRPETLDLDIDYSEKLNPNDEEIIEEEEDERERRSFGELTTSVLLSYFSSVGGWLSTLILFSMVLMQGTRNMADIWLSKWVSTPLPPVNVSKHEHISIPIEQPPVIRIPESRFRPDMTFSSPWGFTYFITELDKPFHNSTGSALLHMDQVTEFYVSIYIVFAVSNSIFSLLRSFLYAYGGVCAAKRLHRKLLDVVLSAKIKFFDLNPLGRVLNRFSSDVYSIDDTLPFEMNILFKEALGLIGSVVVTVYGLPWILLLYIPLMFAYYSIQQFYRYTSRDLRRIYALSLSPLYNHFTETLKGLPVVRAARSGHRFIVLLDSYLEQNQKAKFCIELVSQWLNFRLQLIGFCILAGVACLSLFQHHASSISAGVVGLVISYALTINAFLNGLVMYITKTEQEFISMERVHQYLKGLPNESDANSSLPPLAMPVAWPMQGTIAFENVSLKYKDHNPFSLRDVSFKIRACEKVGIVGRTGAGKSSLFMALFRIVDLSRGKITLDGVNTSDVPLKRLRSSLAIVSQDILLFSGTIKENLDPRGNNSLEDMWRVLHQCHLADFVEDSGGLDAPLKKGGEGLSAGQKQLFCLARALLSRTKIVCIDEGTSLLDNEMDSKVQSVIRNAFIDRTVLIIAHRIHTVRDCDRLIVMNEGEVVATGKPSELIEDKSSIFHSMIRA